MIGQTTRTTKGSRRKSPSSEKESPTAGQAVSNQPETISARSRKEIADTLGSWDMMDDLRATAQNTTWEPAPPFFVLMISGVSGKIRQNKDYIIDLMVDRLSDYDGNLGDLAIMIHVRDGLCGGKSSISAFHTKEEKNVLLFTINTDHGKLILEEYLPNEGEVKRPTTRTKPQSPPADAGEKVARRRAPYRSSDELPDPNKSASAEINRRKQQVKLRLKPELLNAIERAASEHGQSRNEWIEDVLTAASSVPSPKP